MKHHQLIKTILLSVFVFCIGSSSVMADKTDSSATIIVNLKHFALGVGGQKGTGVLTYEGKDYDITLKGLELGSIGKTNIEAEGEVYHMENLSEFQGLYFSAKASITIGESGKAGIWLINKHGVTIHLRNKSEGFDFTLGRGGIKIKLKDKQALKDAMKKEEPAPQENSAL